MNVHIWISPFAFVKGRVQLAANRGDIGNPMAEQSTELEREFIHAYTQRHGAPIREFVRVDGGQYRINGIEFNEIQVNLMLETLQEELAEQNSGLVRRLIRFFGGRTRV